MSKTTKLYNKLYNRAWRAQAFAANPGPVDETRMSGRSTAEALALLSHCIRKPGVWIPAVDHAGGGKGIMGSDNVANIAMSIANAMQLKHIEKRKVVTNNYVEIRSAHMTENPWEIV